jgi:hypothetical protein
MEPELEIEGMSDTNLRRPIRQVGPGAYETEIPLTVASQSPFVFRLRGADHPAATRGLYFPYPDESRGYPADHELLRRIAEGTGGRFAPQIDDIYRDYGDVTTRPTPLWRILAGLALMLYLFDIAIRRAGWLWTSHTSSESD